jgi:hypothetical protein
MQWQGSYAELNCMNALFDWCAKKYFGPLSLAHLTQTSC